MPRRQSKPPRQWLILNEPSPRLRSAPRALPRGSGVLLVGPASTERQRRGLRRSARDSELILADEASGAAARVHNGRELRRALLARTPYILLSPLYPTPSHPDWRPLARMRAAALARLAGRKLIALGGMDEARFRRVAPLGFTAWAGISAWNRRLRSRD